MRLTAAILLVAAWAACAAPLAAEEDLNREFNEQFFKLKDSDADASLKVSRSAEAKLDPLGKQDAEKKDKGDGEVSVSTIGRVLQLSIIALLAALVYALSQRSKRRGRGRY